MPAKTDWYCHGADRGCVVGYNNLKKGLCRPAKAKKWILRKKKMKKQ